MSAAQAWPFIVARNANLDWRPILAPGFLIDASADYLLVTESSGPEDGSGRPNVKVVESAKAGTITLIFSSIPATSELLGEARAEPLVDRFGRPLHVVEGLAVQGSGQLAPSDLEPSLEHVHAETIRLFPAFWVETAEAVPPLRSQPVAIDLSVPAPPAEPADQEQWPQKTTPTARPLILLALIVLGAAAWWWWRARAA